MVKIKKSNHQIDSKIKKIPKAKTILRKTSESKINKKVVDGIDRTTMKPSKVTSEELTEIKPESVVKAVHGVLKFHSENPKMKNQLFDEHFPIFLQISCYKVPKGYSKIYRIPLKHPLYNSDSEVCLIVPEVKGIKNSEHDQHKEHYEKLLSDKGVLNVKTIMTFHEFRTEYETFEQKSRLVDLYDIFLADGRISGKVVKKCGKIFYNKRKVPTSVKLQMTKLKEHIDKTLSKTFLHLHLKGNCYTVQIGHNKMTVKQLQENFECIKEFLDQDFPGGFNNIMGLQIFAPRVPSIPVYFSANSGKNIEVPKITSKKPKAFKTYRGELTTLPNAEVVVKPSGTVIVKKITNEDDEIIKQEPSNIIKKQPKKNTNNAKHLMSNNEILSEKKSMKYKRKVEQINEKFQGEQNEKQSKRKKTILTIESGKIEDEAVSGVLTLGDQVKTQKNKNKVMTDLRNQTQKKSKDINSLMTNYESKVKGKKVKTKKIKNVS